MGTSAKEISNDKLANWKHMRAFHKVSDLKLHSHLVHGV